MASTYNLNKVQNSDYENTVQEITVTPKATDGPTGIKETEYAFSKFQDWNGYFHAIPDLQSALIMKSIWNTGKGYTTKSAHTQVILDHISGYGKDTFNDILFNLDLTSMIGGDSFAEIIRDEETKTLLNLKVLDPSSMKIVLDEKGIIKRYEQINKTPQQGFLNKVKSIFGKKKGVRTFKPNQILHLSNNRYADNMHGISSIEVLEDTIKADNESFEIMQKVMRFQARPFIIWKLKTDDQDTINKIVEKIQNSRSLGEDTFIPDDDNALDYEIVNLNISNAIFEWRNDLRNKFYRVVGLPQIVPGAGGQSTESESKVIYTAFGQIVRQRQMYIEKQLWQQAQIDIELPHPDSFFEDLKLDASKDGTSAFQKNDITVGSGR